MTAAPTKSVRDSSPPERVAAGKKLRRKARRSSHAEWDPPADRSDPVALLEQQATSRVPELVPIRHGRMLASAFAFFRGGAAIMAADLAATPRTGIRVQLCGDAHLSNFGGFAAPDRDLVFDVNDFDETLPGPWEWDVKRLAASLEIAGRENGFGSEQRGAVVLAAVREYREAMRRLANTGNLDVWYQRLDVGRFAELWGASVRGKEVKALEHTVAKARAKDSLRAFSKLTRTVDGERRIISDPPLIVPIEELAPGEDAAGIEDRLEAVIDSYRDSLPNDRRRLFESYRYVHSARKVVGVGSVGTRAWIVLLLGRDQDDPLFLPVKEAQPSVLEAHAGVSEFTHPGKRVVEGQRLMQAASDIFLGWLTATGEDGEQRYFYVRQLWDQKASSHVELMPPDEMTAYAEACGSTLARAHARAGDRAAIAGYLGGGTTFETAITDFAAAYADQNERDFAAFKAAVEAGRLAARTGL